MRSTHDMQTRRQARYRLVGLLLALLAWCTLTIAPVAAQTMMRTDPAVPGAVLCSVNAPVEDGSGEMATPHCPLCTLAQLAIDLPSQPSHASLVLRVPVVAPLVLQAAPRAPPVAAGHPPRAPPFLTP